MIVSRRNKFIFIHNPKCAGTSFRNIVIPFHDHDENFWGIAYDPFFQRKLDRAHLRLWELQAVHPAVSALLSEMRSLIFVRDPFARFLSAITEHFSQYRPHERLLEQNEGARQYMIERFVAQEITVERVTSDYRFVHFSPQSWFIKLGATRKIRHLVPLTENSDGLARALGLLGLSGISAPALNVKLGERGRLHHSEYLRDFVTEFYRQDYELFENEPDLAQALRLGERTGLVLQPPRHRRPGRVSPYLRHQMKRVSDRLRRLR